MLIDLRSRAFRVALVSSRIGRVGCVVGFQSLGCAVYHSGDASVTLWCDASGGLQAHCSCYEFFNGSLCLHIPSSIDLHSERVRAGVRSSLRSWVSRGRDTPFLLKFAQLPKSKNADGEKTKPFSPFKGRETLRESAFLNCASPKS